MTRKTLIFDEKDSFFVGPSKTIFCLKNNQLKISEPKFSMEQNLKTSLA